MMKDIYAIFLSKNISILWCHRQHAKNDTKIYYKFADKVDILSCILYNIYVIDIVF